MASLHTHRKLLQLSPTSSNSTSNNTTDDDNNNPTVQTCLNYCYSQKNTYSGFCPQVCLAICPSLCHYSFSNSPLPPDFSLTKPNKPHNNNHSPLLISMLILLATTFLLITFYILYTKLYFHFYAPNSSNSFLQTRPRSRRRRRSDDHSLDEEHGHRVVFHPFWYISTVGLPTTAIQRIAVVKYGKETEEKDCAVCLAEFEEGENLRVLPKCSHAFHIPCIDTWLSSHTTCPLCRAPIFPPDHDDDHCDHNPTVENASSSSVVSVEASVEDTSPDGELRDNINNIMTTREEDVDINNLEYCIDDLRRVNNNKGSFSQRWFLERGAANLLNRSLSCSGKIFSSSCSNRPCPTP